MMPMMPVMMMMPMMSSGMSGWPMSWPGALGSPPRHSDVADEDEQRAQTQAKAAAYEEEANKRLAAEAKREAVEAQSWSLLEQEVLIPALRHETWEVVREVLAELAQEAMDTLHSTDAVEDVAMGLVMEVIDVLLQAQCSVCCVSCMPICICILNPFKK
jgi:hypothetical protein